MTFWISVDDHVLPAAIAGHPALELCNTRCGWGTRYEERQEYLRTLGHLAILARHHGLLDADRADGVRRQVDRHPTEAANELTRARALRADLHAVVTSTSTAAASRRVSVAVGEARARQVLVHEGDAFRWSFAGRPALRDPLDAFLVAAGELLTSRPPMAVSACPGHDCGWLFTNPRGRRRWCQMAVCGNRAKQARHAAGRGQD